MPGKPDDSLLIKAIRYADPDLKMPKKEKLPAINGWRREGAELPALFANSSDSVELIPGTLPPHKVAVHPTPKEFVAVTWKSPVTASLRIATRVTHAHPACGNGVAWWLEHRRAGQAGVLAEGVLDVGGSAKPADNVLKIEKGDLLILAVDARNGDHSCDLTEIALTVTETQKPERSWDLATDVADTVHAGNPHFEGLYRGVVASSAFGKNHEGFAVAQNLEGLFDGPLIRAAWPDRVRTVGG